MTERSRRRLAAIVAADVAGYSRLIGLDEEGTLGALRSHRRDFIDPLVDEHGGRIANTAGDSLLLEFPSAVDAVRCAIALQDGMAARNSGVPADRRIRFRIGINVGDVIAEGSDLLGDGVNIAARLEGICEPDGILLSEDAYRQVRNRIETAFNDEGPKDLKNIADPVTVWRWPVAKPKTEFPAAAQGVPLPLPEKPSIAVLPFTTMVNREEYEEFADGMTEDLITDLSKIAGLFVVARNSSFSFKGQSVDVREIARRLGVRYILEGSLRRAGARVRINAQLIDSVSGGHVWADRYDGALETVFELQDEVCAEVVAALSVQLSGAEQERLNRVHTSNLEAYELYLRAKATPYPPLPERIAAAREMFERVIELDAEFAGGYAGVAWTLAFGAMWSHQDASAAVDRAESLARQAIEIDETFAWSHTALGLALLNRRRFDDAIDAAGKAIVYQPSDADAHAYQAVILAMSGRYEEGFAAIDRAIRLNPQFVYGPYLNICCLIKTMAGDYAGAVEAFEQNVKRQGPIGPPALCSAGASYWALGRKDDASRAVALLADGFPQFRLTGWNSLDLIREREVRDRVVDLILLSGVPR